MRWKLMGIVAAVLLCPILAQAEPLLGVFKGFGTGSGTGHGEFATFNFYEPPVGASYNVLGDIFVICTALPDPFHDCGTDGAVVQFTGNLSDDGQLMIGAGELLGSFINDVLTISGTNPDGSVFTFVASRVNVPEPEQKALFGAALAALIFVRRRRAAAAPLTAARNRY